MHSGRLTTAADVDASGAPLDSLIRPPPKRIHARAESRRGTRCAIRSCHGFM